jgi:hypothetical protein
MDYKARFYSPYLNRFIQPDSIVPHPLNSQAFNRYSYVYNNPITYIDPTGHGTICNEEGQCFINGQASTVTIHPEDYDHEDWEMPSEVITPQPLRPPICNDEGTCYANGQEIPSNIPSLPHFQDYAHDDWEMPLDSAPPMSMFEAFSTIGDIAEGGFFAAVTIYAAASSCAFAFPACLITLPIFFIMTVAFLQHMTNGIQSYRQRFDPSIKPTGREFIDFVFPILRKD